MRAPALAALATLAVVPVLLLAAAGCQDHAKMAKAELEKEGLADAELTEKEGPGHEFAFSGKKAGVPCKGTITVTAMPGSSKANYNIAWDCEKPESERAKVEDEDPFAADRKGCDEGDLDACTKLGVGLTEGLPAQRDLPKAREVHGKACDGGKLASCVHLGFLHLRGLGGAQSEPEAEALFTKACDAGTMAGCGHLGRLRYINRRYADALALFEKACQGGDFPGCNGLGELTKEGLGTKTKKPDPEKAKDLFQMACDGGDMAGCANVGEMYMKGEGGMQSNDRAREALKKACDADIAVACMNLRKLP